MKHAIRLSLVLGLAASLPAEVISLRSGNGAPGGPDALVTFLEGPLDSEFGLPLTAAQLAAAEAGPPAVILPYLHNFWARPLAADPLAQYISDNPDAAGEGHTNLYAVPFLVQSPSVGQASLDFHFLVDNFLGELNAGVNEGLFLNGEAVPNTRGGNFQLESHWLGLDVTDLLRPGANTLHILASDVGGPSSLMFSASLAIEAGTVEAREPVAGFALGANAPNPFNPSTTISFQMAETGHATLTVHDLAGGTVATLWNGLAGRGAHDVVFDAGALPSGLYLYTLDTEQGSWTRKMALIR
jgi:hypothetical protein